MRRTLYRAELFDCRRLTWEPIAAVADPDAARRIADHAARETIAAGRYVLPRVVVIRPADR